MKAFKWTVNKNNASAPTMRMVKSMKIYPCHDFEGHRWFRWRFILEGEGSCLTYEQAVNTLEARVRLLVATALRQEREDDDDGKIFSD